MRMNAVTRKGYRMILTKENQKAVAETRSSADISRCCSTNLGTSKEVKNEAVIKASNPTDWIRNVSVNMPPRLNV